MWKPKSHPSSPGHSKLQYKSSRPSPKNLLFLLSISASALTVSVLIKDDRLHPHKPTSPFPSRHTAILSYKHRAHSPRDKILPSPSNIRYLTRNLVFRSTSTGDEQTCEEGRSVTTRDIPAYESSYFQVLHTVCQENSLITLAKCLTPDPTFPRMIPGLTRPSLDLSLNPAAGAAAGTTRAQRVHVGHRA
ncbi:hypothetical protein GGS23DRAFT_465877 [Durotheca rogersii]|uniref:uncharacterized protein n=1 Tax=Durotheca rogersii TaxID=419775 RepID=UPI00222014FD|nr:uncharacterized protein GGS23DRAFT_465877 [Durotheca rogersii]KAI5864835.1 hypothetical protein GGS23DRAFT_465877 [Durotheca rogersii]